LPGEFRVYTHLFIRFAEAYGLAITWPEPFDTEWIRPHAAYLYAETQGLGRAFALVAYAARFSQGRNIGAEEVLTSLADTCGLKSGAVVQAAHDPSFHERVRAGMRIAREDGLFGVPFFVYRGHK
jgi:predicted DsbA family dithiol-disulfide isomerase